MPEPGSDPFDEMVTALSLTATGEPDEFVAPSQWMPHGRVFGGQVLAQTVVAAGRTVDPTRRIHSLHGYFLRAGSLEEPIAFGVDRIHDGRSFSARRVQAYQGGLPIFSMIASFQDDDPGLDHQSPMPDLPDPETLPTAMDVLGHLPKALSAFRTSAAFDIRYAETPIYLSVEGEPVAHQTVWLRCIEPLPEDPALHAAVFAYASDYTILESVLRRHRIPWGMPGMKIASLDHAMWWHRPGRADEWFAYVQTSPNAIGGRGLGVGRIYAQDGTLIASVAQEGMIRVPA